MRDPQDVWGVGEKASMRNGPKQFFAEIKTTPLSRVNFFELWHAKAWASLVRASGAVPISITPRNAVGGVVARSRRGMARF